MWSAKRRALLGGLVAVSLPVSAALAATPTSDGDYSQQKNDRMVVQFHVSKDGKKVENFTAYGKCNPTPFNPPVAMKITKGGAFNLTGRAKDVLGEKHKIVIHGKFTSADKAKGTVKVDGKGCKGRTIKFNATLVATGEGQAGV